MLAMSTPAFAGECDSLVQAGQSRGLKFGKDARKTTIIGAVAGGLLGGLLGRATSRRDDRDGGTARGVAIGALLGGAAGLSIGQVAERRRSAFESESAYLDCEISNAQESIAQRDAEIATAQQQYAAMTAEIESLNARIAANNASRRDLRELRKRISGQVSAYENQMAACQKEIDYYEAASQRREAAPGESAAGLQRRRQKLAQRRGELQSRYNQIAQIRDNTLLASSSLKG